MLNAADRRFASLQASLLAADYCAVRRYRGDIHAQEHFRHLVAFINDALLRNDIPIEIALVDRKRVAI